MRRTVPLLIAFVVGVVLLAQYFTPALSDLYDIALEWSPVIVGVTAFLGIISFLQHHWKKSRKRSKDWGFSALALVAFFVMLIAAVWGEIFGDKPPEVPPTWGEGEKTGWVSFEDVPDDAGAAISVRWKLVNRIGDTRSFEIHRKRAGEADDTFAKIAEFKGGETAIGRPRVNREIHGKNLPDILQNGDFESGLDGWTVEGVSTDENEYRGTYAVLPDGASVLSPAFSVKATERFRLSGIARCTTPKASLETAVFVEGSEDEPLLELSSVKQQTLTGAEVYGEWTDAVPVGLANDVLAPAGRDEVQVRFRFTAVGGEVWLDDVAFRPVDVEFNLAFVDEAEYQEHVEFPRYGEGKNLLSDFNPTFDGSVDDWTFDPPAPSEEWQDERRKERMDKEGKHCVEIPAGTAFVSSRMDRPEDPMGHRYSFRLRGWGKGGDGGMKVEVLGLVENVEEPAVLGSADWEPGSDWEIKELTVGPPPEGTLGFRIRYTAGPAGSARVDDMRFTPVKTEPVEGVEYVYRVLALGAEGQVLELVDSAPISGDWETIGSWKAPYGAYQWMFWYLLVPMEATMFALLAFFIASAAFRSFRARSLEATLLLVAAIFVMIGRVPLGEEIWRPLGDLADWIMTYPNGAGKRAIMIGVGLGICATTLKLMLGIERTYLGKG